MSKSLKDLVLAKRQAEDISQIDNQNSNGSWVKRSDIQQQKQQKYYEDQEKLEKQKSEKEEKRLKQLEDFYRGPEQQLKRNEQQQGQRQQERGQLQGQEPPVPRAEVIKRLRALNHPITMFGETDWMRFRRMKKCEIENSDEIKIEDTRGNIFGKLLKMNEDEFKNKMNQDEVNVQQLEQMTQKFREINQIQNEKQQTHQQYNLIRNISHETQCEQTYVWCKKVLKDWEHDLNSIFITEADQQSIEGQRAIGSFRQSVQYVQPLLEQLKSQTTPVEIIDSIYQIANYCLIREYVQANDKYLELAIGNAPWPMGVTMVGIHERSGRSKIFSSQIAHILNDETQRQYLQVIKRLITISQRLYPSHQKSQNINFHVKADGVFY